MSEAKDILDKMVSHFDADEADDMAATFQFDLGDSGNYYLIVENTQCSMNEGEHDDPTVVLNMDVDTLKEVMSGELDGMAAFMQGRIRAEGDILLAAKLTQIFPLAG